MNFDQDNIKKILLETGYLEKSDIAIAEKEAQELKLTFVDYILNSNLLNRDLFGQAIAEFLDINYLDLNSNPPVRELVLELSEELARRYRIVIFKRTPEKVIIATDNPDNEALIHEGIEELKRVLNVQDIEIGFSLTEDIDESFLFYRAKLETRFSELTSSGKIVTSELLAEIIHDAIIYRSSDIHFEPQKTKVLIRFRIDGILHEAGTMPKDYYENVLNRVKVLASMRIDEHLTPQDGAIRFELNKKFVDLRVSVVPVIEGEKTVIRILSVYVRNFSLTEIGMSEENRIAFELSSKKPFGMILVVGPTGSGKSTSLYALLKELNASSINITTIEDPVEYKIEGVNQIQVNQRTNLTFANGLRSIVRQDPDIILVGEIRDQETAEIAVNSALTGHLLLSTFHANDAATALPRLLDIGVEPFLLSSTLELVISQRLVRRICENCRYSQEFSAEELKRIYPSAKKFFKSKETFYKGKGCPSCNNTGYKGSSAVFEIIKGTTEMKDLILKNPNSNEIWRLAYAQGSRTMFEDGLEKVRSGLTSMEELLRVTKPLEF
ncbi:MAG: GspE/PulE family protein [Candidatus Pacebacteria bacterium]|nr:GspE/PulE family protein [Candidatus Paceibacterota bacterium]